MAKIDKNRDTAATRLQIISPLVLHTGSSAVTCAQIAIDNKRSVKTIRRWVQAYKAKGFNGLIPDYKGGSTIKKTYVRFDEVLSKAISMRQTDPRIPVKNIIFAFESENPECKGIIKRSTLQRHLQEHHYGKKELLAQEKMDGRKCFRRYRRKTILDIVQCDVKEFPKGHFVDENGAPCSGYVQICIDNCSRKIISYKVGLDQRTHIVTDCLKQIVSEIGIPKNLHLDNGAAYKSKIVMRACKILNINIIRCDPYAGYQKGVVERVNGKLNDLENQILAMEGGIKFETFKKLVAAWVDQHNLAPHSTLKEGDEHLSPEEYWNRHFVKHETADEETINYVFKASESRNVSSEGTISINKKNYEVNVDVSPPFSTAEVLINPDGTVEQILANYKTQRIYERIMPEHAPARKKKQSGRDEKTRDISYLKSLLREQARAQGRVIDDALEKEIDIALAPFIRGQTAKAFANTPPTVSQDCSDQQPEQDPPAGNRKKVERGMGNNHSPFLGMDDTQGK